MNNIYILQLCFIYVYVKITSQLSSQIRAFQEAHMRRFTSTAPARDARAPNRAISNSCL